MANYITNIPGSTIDKYLQEGHEALSKANSAVKTLGNTQTATAVTILGATSTIIPAATQIPAATTTKAGVMSAADKVKLGGLYPIDGQTINVLNNKSQVNVGSIVDDLTTKNGNNKIVVKIDNDTIVSTSNGIKLNPSKTATTSANGLMSASDKTFLELQRQKYINAGATYNAATGYYSLNGLTDITEAEMSVIYEDTYRKQCSKDLSYLFYGSNARTNFPPRNRGTYENGLTCLDLCYCRNMEVFKWGQEYRSGEGDNYYGVISNATEMFNGCIALRKIIGVLNISGVAATPTSMFANCNVLEDVQILGLKTNLELTSRPISHDSLMFLVEHAANTSAITVKVHQDVWAKINSAEWDDIYVAATDKNIEFVANN